MLKKIFPALALGVALSAGHLPGKDTHRHDSFDWTKNLAASDAMVERNGWQATVPFFPARDQPGLLFPLDTQGEPASLLGFALSTKALAFSPSRREENLPTRRQPLDFSLRPMMYEEHVHTHYFPEATWEPGTGELRKRLATIPMAPRPRLFPGLESHPFADLPAVVSNTIGGRARAMTTPGSANYLDLNAVGKEEANPAHARFMNQQLLDLLAAWKITGETRYAEYAENFCRAVGMLQAGRKAGSPLMPAASRLMARLSSMNLHRSIGCHMEAIFQT
jgi:hypothetical protein